MTYILKQIFIIRNLFWQMWLYNVFWSILIKILIGSSPLIFSQQKWRNTPRNSFNAFLYICNNVDINRWKYFEDIKEIQKKKAKGLNQGLNDILQQQTGKKFYWYEIAVIRCVGMLSADIWIICWRCLSASHVQIFLQKC